MMGFSSMVSARDENSSNRHAAMTSLCPEEKLITLSDMPRWKGEIAADDGGGHGRGIGEQKQQGPDHVVRLADPDRGTPARIIGPGIGSAILWRVDHPGRD